MPGFWDREDVNRFLPSFERGPGGELRQVPEYFDEPDASEFPQGQPGWVAGPPLPSGQPTTWDRPNTLQDRMAEFLRTRKRAGSAPAPQPSIALQAQAIEGR